MTVKEALQGWEQYIYPPLGDHLLLGDILRMWGASIDAELQSGGTGLDGDGGAHHGRRVKGRRRHGASAGYVDLVGGWAGADGAYRRFAQTKLNHSRHKCHRQRNMRAISGCLRAYRGDTQEVDVVVKGHLAGGSRGDRGGQEDWLTVRGRIRRGGQGSGTRGFAQRQRG